MSSPEEHTFQSKNTKFFQIEFSKERAVSSRESSVAGSLAQIFPRSVAPLSFPASPAAAASGIPAGRLA